MAASNHKDFAYVEGNAFLPACGNALAAADQQLIEHSSFYCPLTGVGDRRFLD
jgi:hypothetical protein